MSLVIPLNVSAEERGWTATARGWERPGQLITVAWKNGQVDHAALWDVAPARRPRMVLVESLYRSNRHKKLVILRWLVADRPDPMDVADPPPWGHDYAPTLTPSVNGVASLMSARQPNPEENTMATKVTQLTGSNVHALKQAVQVGMAVEHIGATVAIFPGSAADALKSLADAREVLYRQHGGRGHPVQSLAAVRRKLERQL